MYNNLLKGKPHMSELQERLNLRLKEQDTPRLHIQEATSRSIGQVRNQGLQLARSIQTTRNSQPQLRELQPRAFIFLKLHSIPKRKDQKSGARDQPSPKAQTT